MFCINSYFSTFKTGYLVTYDWVFNIYYIQKCITIAFLSAYWTNRNRITTRNFPLKILILQELKINITSTNFFYFLIVKFYSVISEGFFLCLFKVICYFEVRMTENFVAFLKFNICLQLNIGQSVLRFQLRQYYNPSDNDVFQ